MTLSGGSGGRSGGSGPGRRSGSGSGGAGDPKGKRSWVVTAAVVVATAVLLYIVISTLATGRFF
jgi:hypothetical protein